MAQELTWKISIDPAQSARVLQQHAQEVQRAAAEVTRINAQTARQAEAQSRIQERAANSLADAKIREGRRGLRDIERQLAQEVRANREAQRQIERAAVESQRRRSAFMAGAAGGVTALVGLSAASEIRNAASAWVDYASKLENTRIAFTTMLGSAEAADRHLKELQQFALKTPFQFGELIDASQRMQALGFNAQQVIPILTDVGNAVAAAGGGSERLDRVVLALSQIQSKGKVMTQELNQLAESGIPAWRMMEEQLGKTRGELVKMVEQGQISSQVFLDAFQKFSQQNFGGLMEAQSKTFTGAMSNIKDALLQTSATAFAPLYERISETARELAKLSTTSKEFQTNLTTAGAQIIRVWDGIAEAFYLVRDAMRIVSAVGIQIIGGLTHTFLALASAVAYVLHGLEALGRYMAGDFAGAHESAARAENALRSATEELTQAARSQFAVAEALGQIWTEAGARARAAGIAMQVAAAVMNTFPQAGGSMTLSGGLQPGAARGAGAGSGKGRGGGGKKSTFLDDATKEAQLAEREIMQRLDTDVAENKRALDEQARSIEEFTRRAIQLAEERHDASIVRINAEIAALDSAFAKRLIKEREYNHKSRELDIENAEAAQKFSDEKWELEQRRDRDTASAEFAAHQRSAQIAEEASERLIRIIQDRVERQIISEAEGERQIAELEAVGYARRKALLEDELTRITTSLERKREINDDLIRLDGERADAAERAAQRIREAQESELPQRPRRVRDATRPRSVEEEEFGGRLPPELSIWEEALGAIQERMEEFHAASQLYVVGAFHGMAEAATDAVQAWILYGGSLGKALKQALAAELAAIAARAAIQAALHAAYAIGSLAFGNFAAAAQHGLAAAKFAAVAALTGIAARGLAVSAAGAQSGGVTAGSAFQSATQPRSQAGQPTTIGVNRRTSAQPSMVSGQIEIVFKGDAGDFIEAKWIDRYTGGGRLRNTVRSDGQG